MATKKDPIEKAEQDVARADAKLEAAQAEVVAAHQERVDAEVAVALEAQAAQAAVVDEQIDALREAVAPDPARVGYSVGLWNGKPHYRSNDGRCDSFDEEVVRRYVREQMI